MLKLEKKYIKPASFMLTQAFKDDPINIYAFPDPEERTKRMPYAYQFILHYYLLNGSVYITSTRLEGVAVWVHSDNLRMYSWRILTSGAIWPGLKMGTKAGRKLQELDVYVAKKHRELVPNEHWYLLLLGVDPKHQGKGHASHLLNEMLEIIDGEGLPCYLETEGNQNISMYQHFGFEVIDEFTIPNTNYKLIAMLR